MREQWAKDTMQSECTMSMMSDQGQRNSTIQLNSTSVIKKLNKKPKPKPSDFKIPGEYESECLHLTKQDKLFTERFDNLIGELSWKIHPENEVKLYEKYVK